MTLPWGRGLKTGLPVSRGKKRGGKKKKSISYKETALFTVKNNYCTCISSKQHHFNIQMGNSEAQGCNFLLRYFEESLVLIRPKWQHWRPKSSISSEEQVISLQVLITLTSTLVFIHTPLFWVGSNTSCLGEINPFLASTPSCLPLLQTKCLAQTVFLKYTGDRDWNSNQQSASQKQPKRHLVVTSLRQFWSRTHLNQELRGPSLSAANLLSHAVADGLLISNYKQLQPATGMEITINPAEARNSGGLGSSEVFLQRTIPKYKISCLPCMETKATAGLYLPKSVLWTRTGVLWSLRWLQPSPSTETATEWHCAQILVCTGETSQQEILV